MRFTLDSNILVYAVDRSDEEKHRIASDIMKRAPLLDAVLTSQVLGEFLNVVRRKRLTAFGLAREQAERWATLFPVVDTSWEHVAIGAAFAERHKMQLWDSIIWQAARSMHASVFLSEDLQDGFSAEGMTVIDPFAAANRDRLGRLLQE